MLALTGRSGLYEALFRVLGCRSQAVRHDEGKTAAAPGNAPLNRSWVFSSTGYLRAISGAVSCGGARGHSRLTERGPPSAACRLFDGSLRGIFRGTWAAGIVL